MSTSRTADIMRWSLPAVMAGDLRPSRSSYFLTTHVLNSLAVGIMLSGLDDGSDNEPQKQALERPPPVPGENLSAPPMDGVQYLRRVIEESKKCQTVVVAEVKRKPQSTPNICMIPEPATCDKALLPDKEWQISTVADFSDVRQNLGLLRDKLTDKSVRSLLDILPSLEDDEGWLQVVLHQNPDLSAQSQPPAKHGPSTRLCLALSQSQLYGLVEMMKYWLSEGDIDIISACRWSYCLLACLEPPFSSSVYSNLRQISRSLIDHRAKLSSLEAEELPHINVLVCIIGRYFNQVDMADPYL